MKRQDLNKLKKDQLIDMMIEMNDRLEFLEAKEVEVVNTIRYNEDAIKLMLRENYTTRIGVTTEVKTIYHLYKGYETIVEFLKGANREEKIKRLTTVMCYFFARKNDPSIANSVNGLSDEMLDKRLLEYFPQVHLITNGRI